MRGMRRKITVLALLLACGFVVELAGAVGSAVSLQGRPVVGSAHREGNECDP
jgi:hypothetical protein